MLVLGSKLKDTAIMSLQTGTRLARIAKPIIDPGTLVIVAYELEGPRLSQKPTLLMTEDIREMGSLGMIVDSNDDFVGLEDVIKLDKVYELDFKLVGLQVVDDKKHRLGKVEDYTLEPKNFVIQQIIVNRGFFKGLTETSLSINRSQILKIDNKQIVVKSTAKKVVEPIKEAIEREYVNPFRTPTPQPEQTKS